MTLQRMGIGSNLDVQYMVDELVKIEQNAKQEMIDTKKNANNSKISAMTEIVGYMNSLKSAAKSISTSDKIISYQTNNQDLNGMSVTTTSQARSGSYTLNVNQLAQSHKVTLPLMNDDATFEAGSLSFSTKEGNQSITWDAQESLAGIRYLINKEAMNTGIQATIVNADDGESLILSSTAVGESSQFSVTASGGGEDLLSYQKETVALGSTLNHGTVSFTVDSANYDFIIDSSNDSLVNLESNLKDFFMTNSLNIDVNLNDSKVVFDSTASFTFSDSSNILFDTDQPLKQYLISAAEDIGQDLKMTIDNLTITSGNNVVTDALEGVTIDVSQANGLDQNLIVSSDLKQVSASIEDFVGSVNNLLAVIDVHIKNTESEKGAFATDSTMKNIITQIRSMMSQTVTGNTLNSSANVGIEFNRDTRMYDVDSAILSNVLTQNFDSFLDFFTNSTEGIATVFNSYLDDMLDRSGLMASRGKSFTDTMSDLLDDQLKLDLHIANYKERLVKQFTAMDAMVAQMESTGEFLTQWTESMNNAGKK